MSDFTNLSSALSYTGGLIASFTVENPDELKPTELKEMTAAVNKANSFLKTVKNQPVPEYDQKFIKGILKNIEKIKKNAAPIPFNAKPHPKEKLINALSQLSTHLTMLKKQEEKTAKIASTFKVKPDYKIEEISKKRINQPDKDLTSHLKIVEKELASLQKIFTKAQHFLKSPNSTQGSKPMSEGLQNKISTHLKKTETVLKKTDIVLLKGMALHKTLATQPFNSETQKTMTKILREITFLQGRMSIQILTGTLQVLAHSFRSTLDEFKSRLQAIKKLRRGVKVEAVEHESEKKEKEE